MGPVPIPLLYLPILSNFYVGLLFELIGPAGIAVPCPLVSVLSRGVRKWGEESLLRLWRSQCGDDDRERAWGGRSSGIVDAESVPTITVHAMLWIQWRASLGNTMIVSAKCPVCLCRLALMPILLLFLLCAAAPVAAQVELGVWGGGSFTTLAYTKHGGIGAGMVGLYRMGSYLSVQLAGGALGHAVSYPSGSTLPHPASERMFATWIVPVELWLRCRISGDVEEGSVVLSGGLTGAYVTRDGVGLAWVPGDAYMPAFSTFASGVAGGVGFETALFIAGKGRLFGDLYLSRAIAGVDDKGYPVMYGVLRIGTAFVL